MTAIRTAFLLQYSRVFTTARMKLVARLALALVSMWSASQLILSIFSCIPVNKFWDPTVPGSCIPHYPNWYINAGGNIMTDVLIIVIPLPVLAGLSLRPAQKIVLVGIFSLGFFVRPPSLPSSHCFLVGLTKPWSHRHRPYPSSVSNTSG